MCIRDSYYPVPTPNVQIQASVFELARLTFVHRSIEYKLCAYFGHADAYECYARVSFCHATNPIQSTQTQSYISRLFCGIIKISTKLLNHPVSYTHLTLPTILRV